MQKLKKYLIPILITLAVIGGLTGAYFIYESVSYFKTNNAAVSADTVKVVALASGTVSSWDVSEGDTVKLDQVLGNLDVSSMISSSKIDQTALENTADSVLSKAEIKSPIEGTLVQSNVVRGAAVAAGSTVAVVADTADTYIKANIEETNIFKIKVGQRVNIKIDAYPNKNFTGYVESIGAATESALSGSISLNTSGTFSKVTQLIPVRITLINDEGLPLLIGMNTTVKISLAK